VLAGGGDSAAKIVDFTRALRASVEDEPPEIIDVEELVAPWGDRLAKEEEIQIRRRAEALGALRELPDGRIEVISPRMYYAAVALGELGFGRENSIATAERIRQQVDQIAFALIELFGKEIWQPFEEAGRPKDQWPKVRDALDRLPPLALEALLGFFQVAMGEATEKASAEILRRASSDEPPKAGGKRKRSSAGGARQR
jgi:hypothetical protein